MGTTAKSKKDAPRTSAQPCALAPDAPPQNVAVFRSVWLSTKRAGQQTSCRSAIGGLRLALATRNVTPNAGAKRETVYQLAFCNGGHVRHSVTLAGMVGEEPVL